jgi:hypothetical protein
MSSLAPKCQNDNTAMPLIGEHGAALIQGLKPILLGLVWAWPIWANYQDNESNQSASALPRCTFLYNSWRHAGQFSRTKTRTFRISEFFVRSVSAIDVD